MKKRYLVVCLCLIGASPIISQKINPPKLVGEFEENGYTIKEIYYPFTPDCDEYGRQFEISLDGKILVKSRIWQFMGPWNFCDNHADKSPVCYFKDINGDSTIDIVFEYGSGGNDGCEDLEIYSIDSTAFRIAFLRLGRYSISFA